MYLVYEKNNLTFGGRDLVYNRFKAFFKLAFVFCTSHQRAHVERKNLFGAQVFGNIATDDAVRKTFGNGGFAGARLADEHGVVLGATRQNLKHPADFFVATDHRVELAGTGAFVEVHGIFRKGVVGFLGALVGGFLSFAQLVDRSFKLFGSESGVLKNRGGR